MKNYLKATLLVIASLSLTSITYAALDTPVSSEQSSAILNAGTGPAELATGEAALRSALTTKLGLEEGADLELVNTADLANALEAIMADLIGDDASEANFDDMLVIVSELTITIISEDSANSPQKITDSVNSLQTAARSTVARKGILRANINESISAGGQFAVNQMAENDPDPTSAAATVLATAISEAGEGEEIVVNAPQGVITDPEGVLTDTGELLAPTPDDPNPVTIDDLTVISTNGQG